MRISRAFAIVALAGWLAAGPARAQTPDEEAPEAAPAEEAPAPPAAEPEVEPAPEPEEEAAVETGQLVVHVVSTRGVYVVMRYDLYDVETREMVGEGRSVDESLGHTPEPWTLSPGLYRIVQAGSPYAPRADYLTVRVLAGETTHVVLIVDPTTLEFRGGGIVTDDLPVGVRLAGVRIGLNVGGTVLFNRKDNPVGHTPGNAMNLNAFANLGLVFSRDEHLLSVDGNAELGLDLRPAMPLSPIIDRLEGSATYTYKLNNPYFGPYVRGAFRTQIFPSYLYLESPSPVSVAIVRPDGSMVTETRGQEANVENLRIRVADPFAPMIIQEGLGGNLHAVNVDLTLIKASVQTRLGYGLRHGLLRGVLVPEGPVTGPTVTLLERPNYFTHGPELGADVNLTVTRHLFGQGSFMMLYPLKDRPTGAPIMELAASAGLRLGTLASLNYSVRLEYDAFVFQKLQVNQLLGARINWNLL